MVIIQRFLFVVMLFIQTAFVTIQAQEYLKDGDEISGLVCNSEGPMMLVSVLELDSCNHIVNRSYTNAEGRFSFKLSNSKNTIRFVYPGFDSMDIAIDKAYFEIEMTYSKDEPDVVVYSERLDGGDPLPTVFRDVVDPHSSSAGDSAIIESHVVDGRNSIQIPDSLLFPNGVLEIPTKVLEGGDTLEAFILKIPGAKKVEDGSFLFEDGKTLSSEEILRELKHLDSISNGKRFVIKRY